MKTLLSRDEVSGRQNKESFSLIGKSHSSLKSGMVAM